MAIVTFEALSAGLYGGAGEYERATPGLYYHVRLARGESITLTTRENFKDLEITFNVVPSGAPAPPIKGDATGLMSYHPAIDDYDYISANCSIQVWVPSAHFVELVAAARNGRVPARLNITVEKMSYDNSPDGSGKKWDNQTESTLHVASFSYSLPLVASPPSDESDEDVSGQGMPPTRAQFVQLIRSVDLQRAEIGAALKSLFWAAIAISVVLLVLRWMR
jgi:hypothetical protein